MHLWPSWSSLIADCRPWVPSARAFDTVPSQWQAWLWGRSPPAPRPGCPAHAVHAGQHHLRARHAQQSGHAEQPWRAPASHVPPRHDAAGAPRRANDAPQGGSRRSGSPHGWPCRRVSTQLARAAQQEQRPAQLPGAASPRMSVSADASAPARLSGIARVGRWNRDRVQRDPLLCQPFSGNRGVPSGLAHCVAAQSA